MPDSPSKSVAEQESVEAVETKQPKVETKQSTDETIPTPETNKSEFSFTISSPTKEAKKSVGGGGGEEEDEEGGDDGEHNVSCPDPYYPPIIYLPEVEVNAGEDDEEEIVKLRARLYRYANDVSPPEWKERGTGDIRILKHTETGTCRVVMRREKTLKLCANHLILPWMDLKKNVNSEKAWVWQTQADFADEEPKRETLAVRFGSVENAKKWNAAFEKAKQFVLESEAEKILQEEKDEGAKHSAKNGENKKEEEAEVTGKLEELSVKE